MARTLDLLSLKEALAILGIRERTAASRDVGRVVLDLCNEAVLPGPNDVLNILPPKGEGEVSHAAYGRRVPGRNLWVWYFTNGRLRIVGVTRHL